MGNTGSKRAPVSGTGSGSKQLSDCIKNLQLRLPESSFFDREDELNELLGILAGSATKVTIITGPKNSGKSRLLTHLVDVWTPPPPIVSPASSPSTSSAAPAPSPGLLSPLILVNMGMHDCSSPDLLAQEFRTALSGWSDAALEALKAFPSGTSVMGVPVGEIFSGITTFFDGIRTQAGLGAIQSTLAKYLDRNLQVRPVLALDEANMLLEWEGRYDRELSSLFRFLETMSKERDRIHVLMASSDSFFWNKMIQRLATGNVRVFGLGYFSRSDARKFVKDRMTQQNQQDLPDDWDAMWDNIYEATGGCPCSLRSVVEDSGGSFAKLLPMAQTLVDTAQQGLEAFVDSRTSDREDIKKVFNLIVSKGGYLHKDDLMTEFATESQKAYDLKMVLLGSNFIHLRFVQRTGSMYKNMPPASKIGEYIMASSPPALAALKVYASS